MTPETTCPYCRGTFRAVALHDALVALDEARRERDEARTERNAVREEVDRLTRERHAWRKGTAAERDALAVSLAALREAAVSLAGYAAACSLAPDYRATGDEARTLGRLARPLQAAIAASPAEHGERVLREAEERGRAAVLADDRTAMELGEALAARMAELKFGPRTIEQWTGVAADALAAVRGRVRTARKEGT